ncbi:MAG: Fe-S cluster assembly protein SufD [Chloroflexota bacterium]
MANNKRVIKRGKSSKKKQTGKFNFTEKMIPVMSNGSPEVEFLSIYRKSAWQAYIKKEMPNTSEEAWRRTDISQLDTESFVLGKKLGESIPEELLIPLEGKKHGGQIILKSSGASISLDSQISELGVIFTDFETAAVKHPDILKKILGQLVDPKKDKFSSLAAALSSSGVLLYVPKGVEVQLPLHSILWGPGEGQAYFSHLLIWLEDEAKATYIHEFASPSEDNQTLHSGIVEIHVGESSNLQFVELQSWGDHVWNFSHESVRVERDGKLDWVFGSVGSHLTKNFSEINLIGQGAVGKMSGFYFTDGNQHLDHDTQQNHLAPNTTSDLLFKGALEDESRSVWQGMIYVAPDAQKTDGYQSNPNLVLNKNARADSIPGLEILADDVRCTHGATVGKISEEEIFYLEARGVERAEAERLIVQGFFDPIMLRIPFERVRERFRKAIVDKLD